MFKRKECRNCNSKINGKYEFCPYCGSRIKNSDSSSKDWGMIGKEDIMPGLNNNEVKLPMGFNLIFNSLVKNLNKQFKDLNGDFEKMDLSNLDKGIKKGGIKISISTSGNNPPKIRVNSNPIQVSPKPKQIIKKIPVKDFSPEEIKKFSTLPKEEPPTNIRRLSDKIIYEIEMKDVKSIKDISIRRFENSLEIKALTKKKAYVKSIPINLPIINFDFLKGNLILEFGIKNS